MELTAESEDGVMVALKSRETGAVVISSSETMFALSTAGVSFDGYGHNYGRDYDYFDLGYYSIDCDCNHQSLVDDSL